MNVDRERERTDEEIIAEAEGVRDKHRKLESLEWKVWRHLHAKEWAAYSRLNEEYVRNERVSLSAIAKYAPQLIPGASRPQAKPYIKEYVRSVTAVANYVAKVDRERAALEPSMTQLFESLTPEQTAAAQPLFERLASILTPSQHMRVPIDSDQIA